MKHYRVVMAAEGEEDLLDIHDYVSEHDALGNAEALLHKLEAKCASLAGFPNRGRVAPELARIGVLGFREIFCKPYRVIYQVRKAEGYLHCVLDGRRDLQDLLQRRLLR